MQEVTAAGVAAWGGWRVSARAVAVTAVTASHSFESLFVSGCVSLCHCSCSCPHVLRPVLHCTDTTPIRLYCPAAESDYREVPLLTCRCHILASRHTVCVTTLPVCKQAKHLGHTRHLFLFHACAKRPPHGLRNPATHFCTAAGSSGSGGSSAARLAEVNRQLEALRQWPGTEVPVVKFLNGAEVGDWW